MNNINPDLHLAMFMSSLTKKELNELMKECNKIFEISKKKYNKITEEKNENERNKSMCERLFDY